MLKPVALLCFMICSVVAVSVPGHTTANLTGCFLTLSDTQPIAAVTIAPLLGHVFKNVWDGQQVVTSLCSNVTEKDANVSVTVAGAAYGRRNCSRLVGTERWTLLEYGCGENVTCSHATAGSRNATRTTQVIFTCDSSSSEDALGLVHKDDCYLVLELRSPHVCNSEGSKSGQLSHGSIFCILFGVVFGSYLLVGTCYRRLLLGAKGIDQLPNKDFWLNLGHLQADGCNFVCRRGDPISEQRTDSWQRISGGNFVDSDRDDAPLAP